MISIAVWWSLTLSLQKGTDDGFDAGPNPIFAKNPTVNATNVVFEFAGDLWQVPRHGGDASRLTTTPGGTASKPIFSPDGTKIAFTAQYDGNVDVYVMPAGGGSPKRLTSHPGADTAVGWTPDGRSILFRSSMLSNTDYSRLFTVAIDGGFPKPLPFPAAEQGSFSPDGKQLAYVPNPKWQEAWKRYRGGQTTPIWVGDLNDSHVTAIPRTNTNQSFPMWMGDSIYFLADPSGPVGLYKFDTKSHNTAAVVFGKVFDIKSATAGPGVIAYEKLGSVHIFDVVRRQDETIPIRISGDFPHARISWKDVQSRITSVAPSPSGQRVVVCARGWAFTVPGKKGDTRLLSETQGLDRDHAVWSPDGKSIAYVQDDLTGEHIVLKSVDSGTEKSIELGQAPGTYDNLVWSPDSKRIAYTDNKLNLWVVEVATGRNTLIDTGNYRSTTNLKATWSPDSQWLTYAHDQMNFLNSISVYSFKTAKSTIVTAKLANASEPVFDRGGKYLYFIASTDEGIGIDTEDIAATGQTNRSSQVYAILLRKDIPNPFRPESDEEKTATETKSPAKVQFDIDLEEIGRRIFPVPLPHANYSTVIAGPENSFFVESIPARLLPTDPPAPGSLLKYSFADQKIVPFLDGVREVIATSDGSKLLVQQGADLRIVGTEAPAAPGSGRIDLSDLRVKIDPRQEWTAMYHQAWRRERILFYDPGMHGIDSFVMEKRYEPFLANLRSRADLNYLFTDMMGEICIAHMFIGGGDLETAPRVRGGLLGADYTFENGRYRIARVYDGESWNPELYSPLGNADVRAKNGEYLLAINGQDLTQATDIYLALEGKAGKRVTVKLGPTPDGKGAREVPVTPVDSETALRHASWEEDNRRFVDEATGGKCGYIHVPDTNRGGWTAFMRYYYAQHDKDAIIIDERFNHGGAINDFMVNEMEKPLDFYGVTRYGKMFRTPNAAVYGPKVMLINELAGSGGDIFPYIFKQHKTGKIIGHRTWGGELTSAGFRTIDGGSVRAPEDAQFDIKTGEFIIENYGTPPDLEVEFDPQQWKAGIDSQLKVAVDVIKKEMAAHPPVPIKRPTYPDKSKIKNLG